MNAKPTRLWVACVGLMLLAVGNSHAQEVNIITPLINAGTEGDTRLASSAMGQRYQQLFDASYFSGLPSGGGWIRDIYFRADMSADSAVGFVRNTQISFSTTTKNSESLSPVFAENVGSDSLVFFSSGRSDTIGLSWKSMQGPQLFSALFAADQDGSDGRFFYDPAKGNLLLDIQGLQIDFPPGKGMLFDAVNLAGHTSVHYQFPGGTEQGALSASSLVVLFKISPVPEPSVYAFIGLGVIVFYALKRINQGAQA